MPPRLGCHGVRAGPVAAVVGRTEERDDASTHESGARRGVGRGARDDRPRVARLGHDIEAIERPRRVRRHPRFERHPGEDEPARTGIGSIATIARAVERRVLRQVRHLHGSVPRQALIGGPRHRDAEVLLRARQFEVAPRDIHVAVVLDRDVAPLTGELLAHRHRAGEGQPVIGRTAEVHRALAERRELRPAQVHVPVAGTTGAVDLDHLLIGELALEVGGGGPLHRSGRAQIVEGVLVIHRVRGGAHAVDRDAQVGVRLLPREAVVRDEREVEPRSGSVEGADRVARVVGPHELR